MWDAAVLALQQELSCQLLLLPPQPYLLLPIIVLHNLHLAPTQEVTGRKKVLLSWPYPVFQGCSGSGTGPFSSSMTQWWPELDPDLPTCGAVLCPHQDNSRLALCLPTPRRDWGSAPALPPEKINKRCRQGPYRGRSTGQTCCLWVCMRRSRSSWCHCWRSSKNCLCCVHSNSTVWTCLAPKRGSLCCARVRAPTAAAGDCRRLWTVTLLSALSPWCYLRWTWLLLLPLVHLWCPTQQVMGLAWLSSCAAWAWIWSSPAQKPDAAWRCAPHVAAYRDTGMLSWRWSTGETISPSPCVSNSSTVPPLPAQLHCWLGSFSPGAAPAADTSWLSSVPGGQTQGDHDTVCVLLPEQGKETQLDEKWRLPRPGKSCICCQSL